MPAGYEKIDGKLYPTKKAQQAAYTDIQLSGVPGQSGAFLYGKPRLGATKPLIWPLDKVFITQQFGVNQAVYAQFGLRGHDGIDLRTRFIDSPLAHRTVMAAAAGWCEPRFETGGYGTHVRIHHSDGSLTIYGHLSKVSVAYGTQVAQGESIGITGNTGASTGPHLHLELRPAGWENNKNNGFGGAVDPTPFLPKLTVL